mgnify:CR=1 FL=1
MALPCAQACINQEHIEASLAGLPAYLSGCRFLLVLAGPSYLRRLWCVVEARLLACVATAALVTPANSGDSA